MQGFFSVHCPQSRECEGLGQQLTGSGIGSGVGVGSGIGSGIGVGEGCGDVWCPFPSPPQPVKRKKQNNIRANFTI